MTEAKFCIELVFLVFLDDLKGNKLMKKLMKPAAIAVAFTLLLATSSQAALVLVSDFDGTGTYNSGGTVSVTADPDDAGNNALELTAASDAHVAFNIADGSVGTVFVRVRLANATGGPVNIGSNGGFGVTERDWAAASGQGKFAVRSHVETIRTFDAPGVRTRSTYNDGWASPGGLGNVQQSAPEVWQNFWFVLDTTGAIDTFDMYVEGGDYATPTLVADDARWYREAGENVGVEGFYIYSTGVSPATYIDDIYVDTTGVDLSNPLVAVPEPATLVFALMAMSAGALRPRSRKS